MHDEPARPKGEVVGAARVEHLHVGEGRLKCGLLHIVQRSANLPIGGSTAGRSRRLCGDWIEPDVELFLRNCGDLQQGLWAGDELA